MSSQSLTIVSSNETVQLAYLDSGAPQCSDYITLFAVHGVTFNAHIFDKVSALCFTKGIRFVAIARRGYMTSTPFNPAEMQLATNGTDAQKAEFLNERGREIATFVDLFVQYERLAPISPDGRHGGIALLGWSLGVTYTIAAIASIASLPDDSQERLDSRLRAHIMQEPASINLGFPVPRGTWTPQIDPFIPSELQSRAFTIWITSYFKHGDLSSRDTDEIEYVLPATTRAPSIWNMSTSEFDRIVEEEPNDEYDVPIALNLIPQVGEAYRQAVYWSTTKARLPSMKTWNITGDSTASFSIAARWSLEDDDEARGGNHVNYKWMEGLNHFMHWDEPEKVVEAYLEAMA